MSVCPRPSPLPDNPTAPNPNRWAAHRSTSRYFRHLKGIISSRTARALLPPLAFFGAVAVAAGWYTLELVPHYGLPKVRPLSPCWQQRRCKWELARPTPPFPPLIGFGLLCRHGACGCPTAESLRWLQAHLSCAALLLGTAAVLQHAHTHTPNTHAHTPAENRQVGLNDSSLEITSFALSLLLVFRTDSRRAVLGVVLRLGRSWTGGSVPCALWCNLLAP